MLKYTITSDETQMFRRPKTSVLASMEAVFYAKYLKSEDPTEKLTYLRYYNHVFELRNRLEFGV